MRAKRLLDRVGALKPTPVVATVEDDLAWIPELWRQYDYVQANGCLPAGEAMLSCGPLNPFNMHEYEELVLSCAGCQR